MRSNKLLKESEGCSLCRLIDGTHEVWPIQLAQVQGRLRGNGTSAIVENLPGDGAPKTSAGKYSLSRYGPAGLQTHPCVTGAPTGGFSALKTPRISGAGSNDRTNLARLHLPTLATGIVGPILKPEQL